MTLVLRLRGGHNTARFASRRKDAPRISTAGALGAAQLTRGARVLLFPRQRHDAPKRRSCASDSTARSANIGDVPRGLFRFLAVNDIYKLDNIPKLSTQMKWLSDKDLLARLATTKGVEPENVSVNRVLAGDFLSPNVLSPLDKGFGFMSIFNLLNIDWFCFGNHEGSLSSEALEERLLECRERGGIVLNSNIPGFIRPRLPEYAVVEAGPVKLGMIGILSDEPQVLHKCLFRGEKVICGQTAVKKLAKRLTGELGCAGVVAITHQSLKRDREFAEHCAKDGLVAIIGGHEHTPFSETVNGVSITKSGMDATACGVLDLTVTAVGGSKENPIFSVEKDYCIESTEHYKPDPIIAAHVKKSMSVVEDMANEIVIYNEDNEDGSGPKALYATGNRFRPTALGTLFCDYIKAELGCDVAMLNGGPIKTEQDFADGRLSLSDLNSALPFPTKMIVVEIPGRVIQAAVAYSRQDGDMQVGRRGFLQCDSGVHVQNPTISGKYAKCSDSTGQDAIQKINQGPYDPDHLYSVALPRNLLKGFCNITPLVQYAETAIVLPDDDAFVPAKDIVLRHCAKQIWTQLGSFDDIDLDSDGVITRAELDTRIRSVFGRGSSEDFLQGLMDALDLDSSGTVVRAEFRRFVNKIS